jgi:hypothetical protein
MTPYNILPWPGRIMIALGAQGPRVCWSETRAYATRSDRQLDGLVLLALPSSFMRPPSQNSASTMLFFVRPAAAPASVQMRCVQIDVIQFGYSRGKVTSSTTESEIPGLTAPAGGL